jgi:hypothetical protein
MMTMTMTMSMTMMAMMSIMTRDSHCKSKNHCDYGFVICSPFVGVYDVLIISDLLVRVNDFSENAGA